MMKFFLLFAAMILLVFNAGALMYFQETRESWVAKATFVVFAVALGLAYCAGALP